MTSRLLPFALVACSAACILAIDPLPSRDDPNAPGSSASARADGGKGSVGSDGGTGASDGSTTSDGDASPARPDGGDGSAAAPPNWLVNGGFEGTATGSFPCGSPWGFFQANLASDPNARSGAHACKVCSISGVAGDTFAINYNADNAPTTVDAGATLTAHAWVRALSGITSNQKVSVSIRLYDGANVVDRADCAAKGVSGTYVELDCAHTATTRGLLNIYVKSDGAGANECFIVDDVEVTSP